MTEATHGGRRPNQTGRPPTHPQRSQLVRMRITDAEKERVLEIPPRRRTEVLLAECDRNAADDGEGGLTR